MGDELAEFQALSLKVSEKTATEAERARWRELRERLRAPTAPAVEEQRQHGRGARKLKVGYVAMEELRATFTEELSAGGVRLRVAAHVKPDSLMALRLELGEPGPLLLTARVAWCRRDGGHFVAGLEWVGLREDERERIAAWAAGAERSSGPTA